MPFGEVADSFSNPMRFPGTANLTVESDAIEKPSMHDRHRVIEREFVALHFDFGAERLGFLLEELDTAVDLRAARKGC